MLNKTKAKSQLKNNKSKLSSLAATRRTKTLYRHSNAHHNRRQQHKTQSIRLFTTTTPKLAAVSTMSSNAVHSMSERGFSGAETSKQYDAVRPTYSNQAIETMLAPIFQAYSSNPEASQRPMRILDLGCGTGISTKLIAFYMYEHVAESCDYEIYSADPNQSMVKVFRDSLNPAGLRDPAGSTSHLIKSMSDKGLEALLETMKMPTVASVDDLPFQNKFFDGVIAAQAFHWFCSPQAVLDIQRKLTPHGVFTFCWNYWISTKPQSPHDPVEIPVQDQWMHNIAALVEPLYAETGTPHQRTVGFQPLFGQNPIYEQKFGLSPPFSQLTSLYLDTRPETTRWMNRALFHSRFDSISVVHTLEKQRHVDFFQSVDAILDHPDTPFRTVTGADGNEEKQWPASFWCEVHFAQNSQGGGSLFQDQLGSF